MTFRHILILLSLLLIPFFVARADEYDDINKQLSDLQRTLSSSQSATRTNEKQLSELQTQLQAIKNKVAFLETEIVKKEKEVKEGEKVLVYQKKLLDQRAISYYKNITKNSIGVVDILVSEDIAGSLQNFFYQKTLQDEDRRTITKIVMYIKNLEEKKNSLVSENKKMVAIKLEVDKQSQFLAGEVSKSKAYEAQIQTQISQLSAKQQQLIAAKLGSLNIPLFAYNTQGGCSSDIDPYKDPGFGGDKFALFTYGVPNRVGLNQYGAWGRAKAGQDSDTILRAYYNFDGYETKDTTIKVNDSNGYDGGNIIWTGSLEDYVKRIWEVPDSWSDNNLAALKAQAIAARSYVLAQTDNGNKSICANTNCQVFQTNPKGGNWDSAVSQTAGQVMVQGGQPIAAYFSSTHGGYVYTTSDIGWSSRSFTKRAQDVSGSTNSFSDLNNNAYDKDSDWFYCDWGGRSQYNKTAWLMSSEMADIVNSILLVQSDSSADPHILQTDKSDSQAWSESKVKEELNKHRTPFNSISSGNVDVDFANGRTTRVHFSGDAGSVDFEADVFKKYFNLRAPSNINIVGPLFNVEKR